GLTRRAPGEAPSDSPERLSGERPKYERSGLGVSEMAELEAEIARRMGEDRPWLDPEFNLQDLADGLGCPRNRLSQVINARFGVNFFDFVNGYRVKEVQRLMAEPGSDRYKILALALDAGFASKNTFNAAFKKFAASTPSQYWKSLTEGRDKKSGANG
ncbi:MAG: helix-turn-helix domain-containing protein, partial [Spirochaetaceae bacterium]|nr:helix-turn-helix domain-containing protein [Spirochaetaceae bacterium]